MNWPSLTPELIDSFVCEPGKNQTIYWDGSCPGLGVRVTQSGHKAFVFDSRVRRTEQDVKMRITIGNVKSWSIDQAREVARRYKRMTDSGVDPRDTILPVR